MKLLNEIINEELYTKYNDIVFQSENLLKNIGVMAYCGNKENKEFIEKNINKLYILENEYFSIKKEIHEIVKNIPENISNNELYCYEKNKKNNCPYWTINPFGLSQDNGYCLYLNTGDKEEENNIGLLWDKIKICNINSNENI
jgi:hypothetical protein